MKLTDEQITEWLNERHDNATRIAKTKTGGDRFGWLQDAEYFESAVALLSERTSDRARIERLTDLVRFARHHLAEEEAINYEEFALLVADSQNGQRVARLESYDKLSAKYRARIAELEARDSVYVAACNLLMRLVASGESARDDEDLGKRVDGLWRDTCNFLSSSSAPTSPSPVVAACNAAPDLLARIRELEEREAEARELLEQPPFFAVYASGAIQDSVELARTRAWVSDVNAWLSAPVAFPARHRTTECNGSNNNCGGIN